jgi:hypothetical protein
MRQAPRVSALIPSVHDDPLEARLKSSHETGATDGMLRKEMAFHALIGAIAIALNSATSLVSELRAIGFCLGHMRADHHIFKIVTSFASGPVPRKILAEPGLNSW